MVMIILSTNLSMFFPYINYIKIMPKPTLESLIHPDFFVPANITCSADDLQKAEALAKSGRDSVIALLTSEKPILQNRAKVANCILDLANHFEIDLQSPDVGCQILEQLKKDEVDLKIQLLAYKLKAILGSKHEVGTAPDSQLPTNFLEIIKGWEGLALFPELNPNPVIRINNNGIVVRHNPAADTFFNLEEGEVLPDDLREIIGSTEEMGEREIKVGNRFYMLSISRVPDKNLLNLYFNDITEIRSKDDEIKQLSRFPEFNPNPVMQLNPDGTVVRWNRAANLFPGLEKDMEMPKNLIEHIGRLEEAREREVKIGNQVYLLDIRRTEEGFMYLYFKNIIELKNVNNKLAAFADNVSHDLRNPLTALQVAVGLVRYQYKKGGGAPIERDNLDDQQLISLGVIERQVEQAIAIIENFLLLAKTSSNTDLPIKEINSSDLIKGIVQSFVKAEEISDGEIAMQNDLPVIQSNAIVRQVFQNLIGNAIKYNQSSPKIVKIEYKKLEDGKHEFSVSDNGIGIEPDDCEKIFQPMSRLHRQEYKGTGIGLAIVDEVVKQLGGSIRVESEVGKGSTFYVTLPDIKSEE